MTLEFINLLAQSGINETVETIQETAEFDSRERMRALILLIGVVVGLSVGRTVSFVGQLIVDRDRVTFSPSYVIFLLALFLYQVYYWWSLWDFQSMQDVNFLSFFRLLLIPIFLYGATSILTPDIKESKPDKFSLGKYLESQSQALCAVIFALILTGLSQGIFLFQQEGMRIWLKVAGMLLVLPGIFIRSRIYTLGLSVGILALVVMYIMTVIN